jgi:hypothetical protein
MPNFTIIRLVVLDLLQAERRPMDRHTAKLVGAFLQLVIAIVPAVSSVNTIVKQSDPLYFHTTVWRTCSNIVPHSVSSTIK